MTVKKSKTVTNAMDSKTASAALTKCTAIGARKARKAKKAKKARREKTKKDDEALDEREKTNKLR